MRFQNMILDENTIVLRDDLTCSMASVELNGQLVMLGNYWDFHNGCHGFYDIPEFNSANGLVSVLKKIITDQGGLVKTSIDKTWRWHDRYKTTDK